jgi:hypothetical protein
MDTKLFMDMIIKLSRSVNELEYSVMQAYDSFILKYGAGHKYIERLESYFPAIDKQREYIDQLEDCVKRNDFQMIYDISNKIVAISELIKNDAKSFLFSMNAEGAKELITDTIH